MGFFDDAWDTVKDAATTYAQYANAIYTVPAGYIAKNTDSGLIKQGAGIFSSSFAGWNSYGVTPTMIGGSNSAIKEEKFRQAQGAAISGGYLAAGAAGSALALSASEGKINSAGILAAAGVDPEIASLFPSLDLGEGDGKINPAPGSGAKRAPASALPQLGGESNSYMMPILLIGGAGILAIALFGRK